MSEIGKLIHNPLCLFQLLSSKYSDITEEFECLYLDCILYNKSSHYLSLFKEIVFLDFTEEFLKRFYTNSESTERIPYLADYYKNYHLFFCQPVFRNCQLTKLIHNRCDTKAELFYKKNYGNLNEKPAEKHVTNNDSLSSFDNVTNNKTIFDRNIRKRIDNNIETTMNFENAESSQCIHGSKLYTKRSSNDSLRNILISLHSIKAQNEKETRKRNKNSGLPLKSSLCTLIRTKVNANTNANVNLNEYDKFLLSPKLRPFISNYHSNLIEFNKAKQDKVLTSSNNNNQKLSVIIPNLSQKQLATKNKINNKTCDAKSLAKSQIKKKYVFTGINQANQYQNQGANNNNHCLLSNHHSKSKSQKHSTSNSHTNANTKSIPSNCTYTNFILNAKNKRMNFVQSQRSCSSKNAPFASNNNIKINSMNMCKNYCLSNSNIFTNSSKNHYYHHPNSLKKNNIQFQHAQAQAQTPVHYNDNISRNKKNSNRMTTIRTKNSSNFQGLTTFKASNSIEDKHMNRLELKTIIKELTKDNNEHQTIRFGTKLNDLLKTGHTINWVKQKQQDKDNYKSRHNNNFNDILQHNKNNSPKIMHPNKRSTPGEGITVHHQLSKAPSFKKTKFHSQMISP